MRPTWSTALTPNFSIDAVTISGPRELMREFLPLAENRLTLPRRDGPEGWHGCPRRTQREQGVPLSHLILAVRQRAQVVTGWGVEALRLLPGCAGSCAAVPRTAAGHGKHVALSIASCAPATKASINATSSTAPSVIGDLLAVTELRLDFGTGRER